MCECGGEWIRSVTMNVFLRTLAATRSIPKTATMLGYSPAQAIALTELLTPDQATDLANMMEEP